MKDPNKFGEANDEFIHMGGKSGCGGDTDLNYMHYVGSVMPMTVQGDSTGISYFRFYIPYRL